MNLTFHLKNGFLMIKRPFIHHYINLRNTLTKISNYLCLMRTINMGNSTLMRWALTPVILPTLSPTPQRISATKLILLLRLKSMSPINYIELIIICYILLITCILRSSSLFIPLSFSIVITFQIFLRLRFVLSLLQIMLQLPDDFLQ